jgi:hypothetical protein
MTITALSDDNKTANVRWFEDGTSYKDAIPVAALVSAEQIEQDKENAARQERKSSKGRGRRDRRVSSRTS